MLGLLGLNDLPGTDIAFFIVIAVIIIIAVAIYFLIPVFNKKQYKEQRENLKKREAAFHANKTKSDDTQASDASANVSEQHTDSVEQGERQDADRIGVNGADGR